ncbi:GLPGLI family protein [Flavobacterium album]|uniref:GLPGLI family protein n=1 Tax=Flavobacterium album TaxID=2175091 RepID=A0A2S1QX51_9FLAO|nr:GLPGLI family protein [Flavobacterium album]AWH84997.1 GLPGLI family protein [Flavobacterium album]
MKHFFLFAAALASFTTNAQDFKGVAVYKSMTTMKDAVITVSGSSDPAMDAKLKEAFSKPIENEYILYFDKTASVYEEQAKLNAPKSGGAMSSASFGIGKKYKNLKDKATLEEMDMYGKEFLITDSLKAYDWKLESETKKIGNYNCYKATYTIKAKPPTEEEKKEMENKKVNILGDFLRKDIVVTAWYTPEIPVSHGPGDYWGLPGLILELNAASTTLLCTKVTLNPKEKIEIKTPKKGTKVTMKEFTDIMNKKAEEMQELYRPAPGSTKVTTTTITIGG